MARARTITFSRLTEHHKARFRLPLFLLVAILLPVFTGVRSAAAWITYVLFVGLYCLWTRRLSSTFIRDRRLGYLFCLTDVAVLAPLLVWGRGIGSCALVVLIYVAGVGLSYFIDYQQSRRVVAKPVSLAAHRQKTGRVPLMSTPEVALAQALQTRLSLYASSGTRFALVVLRIARFEEAIAYYGPDAASRMLAAVGRRGQRQLGPDSQRYDLGRGRVALVFEIEAGAGRVGSGSLDWSDPYDVEGMAMRLGRKACERLIEGRRVECVVGWASVPADGTTVDDLLLTAETATRSTEAFRRVAGARVAARVVPSSGAARHPSAVPEEARSAVG